MHAQYLLVATVCLFFAAPAWAQQSAPEPAEPAAKAAPNTPIEESLPEIEVIQQGEKSGNEQKVSKKSPPPVAAEPVTAPASAAAAPVPEAPGPNPPALAETAPAPLPGTLIVSDDNFDSVTTATSEELQSQQGQTLADALASKPGVSASTFAPGASRPILRGLDNNRVRIQESGIGTHDVSALSEDHAVPIDPYSAERVEVIHGPATLRYGGAALGGVVSVENDRIPTSVPPNGFDGAITGGSASVDDSSDGGFKATAGADGVAIHVDGFKRYASDYDTPRGLEVNSFVDSQGGAVGASFVGSHGFVGAALVHVESQYGIPGEDVLIDLRQDRVLSKGDWRVRDGDVKALRFWFGASDYAHDEVAEDGEVGSRFTNQEQELRVEVEPRSVSTAIGAVDTALGVEWGHSRVRGQSFEGSSLLEPAETDRIAGYLFETLALSSELKWQVAGRVEGVRVDGTGLRDFSDPLNLVTFAGERSFTPLSVSTGLAQDFANGVSARLTGQYVERAPTAAELFSQGLHEATGTFEIGNVDLDKERAETIEIGVKKATGALRFDASAHLTRFHGFIFKELTGIGCGDTIETCGIEDELDQVLFTQRDARFHGAELIAELDVAPIWNGVWGIEGQYDFVIAKFDDGENVPRIPPHRLGGGLYYRDANWVARAGVLHAFEQDRIATNETPTDGYTLVSAELSYTARIPALGSEPELRIGIRGENLADQEVRNHSSFLKDEVLQPGASVRVFGSVKLN